MAVPEFKSYMYTFEEACLDQYKKNKCAWIKIDELGCCGKPCTDVFCDEHILMRLRAGLLTGCGKKLQLCAFLEANCAGQKVNCAGDCAGLCNLVSNKISRIPLPVKVNIEFFL